MKVEMVCNCTDKLEEHAYGMDKVTYEEGYLCLNCRKFKPIEDFE